MIDLEKALTELGVYVRSLISINNGNREGMMMLNFTGTGEGESVLYRDFFGFMNLRIIDPECTFKFSYDPKNELVNVQVDYNDCGEHAAFPDTLTEEQFFQNSTVQDYLGITFEVLKLYRELNLDYSHHFLDSFQPKFFSSEAGLKYGEVLYLIKHKEFYIALNAVSDYMAGAVYCFEDPEVEPCTAQEAQENSSLPKYLFDLLKTGHCL